MFGQNPVRKQVIDPMGRLIVQERFMTIQGEGPYAGVPAFFVRLAGCNLRCHFCDTDFESNIDSEPVAIEMLLEEAVRAQRDHNYRLVVLTGGEPMRQNIVPLIKELCRWGFHVQIETAGTLWLEDLANAPIESAIPLMTAGTVSIVVSPKTGSVNDAIYRHALAWKYIIKAEEVSLRDGLPAFGTQIQGRLLTLCRPPLHTPRTMVFVQPCDEDDLAKNQLNMQAAMLSATKFGYRMSLQQHKILGMR
jgi:organic radical activating enzyme